MKTVGIEPTKQLGSPPFFILAVKLPYKDPLY